MSFDLLSKYIGLFGNLHRNQNPKKGYAPHKPILLLALLDEIERGNIHDNLVPITPELVASFRAYWRALVPPDSWVVKALYNDTCSVCGLNVRTDMGSGLVDAAHIMPFGLFHNDDPRNGIAFCKNHHWGFDAGWFSADEEYKIVVSPHLRNTLSYVTADVSLLLPTQVQYAPALAALAWHRINVFLK